MLQTILLIMLAVFILIATCSIICSTIESIILDKQYKEINEKHIEYLNKQMKLLEREED